MLAEGLGVLVVDMIANTVDQAITGIKSMLALAVDACVNGAEEMVIAGTTSQPAAVPATFLVDTLLSAAGAVRHAGATRNVGAVATASAAPIGTALLSVAVLHALALSIQARDGRAASSAASAAAVRAALLVGAIGGRMAAGATETYFGGPAWPTGHALGPVGTVCFGKASKARVVRW